MAEHRAADVPVRTALDAALELPPFFAGFSEETLKTFLPSLAFWKYIQGETVVKEGDSGGDFFVLLQGQVSVRKKRFGSAEREVAKLGAGESFGEIGVLTVGARVATVVAEEACLVASMSRLDLQKVMERQPELAERLEVQARKRLSELGPP